MSKISTVQKKQNMVWSTLQEHRLIELYGQDHIAIEGLGRSVDANKKKKLAWQKLALTLNVEFGSAFDAEMVKKKFQNMKASLRKKQTANALSLNKTGGGQGTDTPLTTAEEHLLSFLGDTKAFTGEKQFVESQMVSTKLGEDSKYTAKDTASSSRQYLEVCPSLEADSSNQKVTHSSSTPLSGKDALEDGLTSRNIDTMTGSASGDSSAGKRTSDTSSDAGPSKKPMAKEETSSLEQHELALRIEVLKKMLHVLEKVEMIVDDVIINNTVPIVFADP
jgi:hypothetical protein